MRGSPPAGMAPAVDTEFYQELKQKFSSISFDEILAEHAIVGDPDHVTERIQWIQSHTCLQHG